MVLALPLRWCVADQRVSSQVTRTVLAVYQRQVAHVSDYSGRRPLSRDRVTLLCALVLIPALLGVFGNWMIFVLFGDPGGTHISVDTFGYSLIHFWEAGGLSLVAGLAVFTFVFFRRHRLPPAVGLGLAGAGLAYAYALIAFFVSLILNPGALS